MFATFPNQGPIFSQTIAFAQAAGPFTAAGRPVHRRGTPGRVADTAALAGQAGFARVRRVEMDNPFNSLYELTR